MVLTQEQLFERFNGSTSIILLDDAQSTVLYDVDALYTSVVYENVPIPVPVVLGAKYSLPLDGLTGGKPATRMEQVVTAAVDFFHQQHLKNRLTEVLSAGWAFIDPGDTDMLIVDSEGRRTGRLDDGTIVQEIPYSTYFKVGEQSGVIVPSASAGRYESYVHGLSPGEYEIASFLYQDGAILSGTTFQETIAEGETVLYSTVLNSESGLLETVLGAPYDFDGDGTLGVGDVNMLLEAIRIGSGDTIFDVTGDNSVDRADLDFYITDRSVLHTWFGDTDLNGEFDNMDIVNAFIAGEYDDGIALNSTWETGDWNGDGEFNDNDLVTAFIDGGYNQGLRGAVAAVPEPSCLIHALFALAAFVKFQVVRRPRV